MFFLHEILQQLPSKRWWLCTLRGHTVPLSHPLVRGAAQGQAWAQRAVPKPLHYPQPERCAGTAGLLSAVFFHQRPRSRGVRSGSLPGWAPSWKFSPIKLKWIIFRWHFHPVQEWSVSQHQRVFASVCFAPAPWCTSTSEVLPSTSCTYARRASQWNCTPQLHEAGPAEIFPLPYFPPSQPAYCEFLKLRPKDRTRQAKICSSLQRNKSIVRATVS